jgi:catechol 2,3-dioxygenase-like lactoylglutathione lyase family enzyme
LLTIIIQIALKIERGLRMVIKNFIQGLQHIGIPTLNMNESIDFYKILGFEIVNKETQVNGGQVFFMEQKGLVIELWESEEATNKTGAINHIALDVSNIEELYQEINSKKMHIITDGIVNLHYWKNGIRYFIIEGPSAERIEFCQINS